MKTAAMNIIQVIDRVFAKWFPKTGWLKNHDSWKNWKIFLRSLFALPMTDAERAIYTQFTGRTDLSQTAYREAHAIVGRRGGKSLVASAIAVFVACFCDHSAKLQAGEVGVVMVIA